MNSIENIMTAFQEHQGFLTLQQVLEENLPYKILLRMIEEGQVEVEEKGLYRLPDTYLDEWFVIQHRFSKGIYSLETALWLHGLSLTVPFEMTMSFPYGTNTKNIKEEGIRPIILRSYYEEGIVELERQVGQKIKVYEPERVLAECLRPVYQVDVQIIAPAFKKYFQNNKVNLPKLFHHAQLFKVANKLQSYLEVLS
ncbi:abortive infection protein AbiGI [Streptococcus agalactiae]|uniref:Abortive infection protein AbiGI n=1 Tax=Streptococcus agalactiae TaxID=1311 RepID=A0AB38VLV7_STRAG|nr:type IV toxin-antitoxin system AbiEi family antitoxin domain-containing protein [Streptococcus agalactiae]MBY5050834.1 type IV toxin-antitoxin system AbiEi family antitoxin domain-containing protein [Streptococcus agalactiae]SUN09713.1 abortive infection protein AbiGI [Streptococcus agalactiae]VED65309.1 abortive infection protein AbiGI [Streptococcus agalactiae]